VEDQGIGVQFLEMARYFPFKACRLALEPPPPKKKLLCKGGGGEATALSWGAKGPVLRPPLPFHS